MAVWVDGSGVLLHKEENGTTIIKPLPPLHIRLGSEITPMMKLMKVHTKWASENHGITGDQLTYRLGDRVITPVDTVKSLHLANEGRIHVYRKHQVIVGCFLVPCNLRDCSNHVRSMVE